MSTNASAPATLLHQTGVLGGRNPIVYSASDPITLFIVQSFIIITLCRLIHIPLSYINQPRVIAEVIVGLLLGPSVMGHVPNFTASIFPTASIPNLTTVANLGLILFLFIVGLEVDIPYVRKNLKVALTVGAVSLIIPFALGWAVAVGLYNNYADTERFSFGTYGLFVAVALCITALPVLARILTELHLLRDRVGVIVLSAGIANDLVGWVLLALTITLANSSKGINTLYTILLIIGWALVMTVLVRPALVWFLRRKKSLERGPSQLDIAIMILLVLVSAFYTDIIGVHPIFGAFIVGTIIPRDNGFVVKLIEKIDDLVSVVLLPQYFALAGLSCNIGLLNDGKIWGYVIAIIVIALSGKFFGGMVAAKFNGLLWRESATVGVLMSCKGIVEIVVLTLGLNAGILTPKVFSMFIVMTLVTTFLTTPLTKAVYPVWYRQKVAKWRKGEINWDGTPRQTELSAEADGIMHIPKFAFGRFITLLNDYDAISVAMSLIELLSGEDRLSDSQSMNVLGVKLVDLSQRTSDLIQATVDADELGAKDPTLRVVNTFTQMRKISFTGKVAVTPPDDQAAYMIGVSKDNSDFLLLSASGTSSNKRLGFGAEVFKHAHCQVGILFDRGFSITPTWNYTRQVYLPFFGTSNDNLALAFALRLCQSSDVRLVVDVISKHETIEHDDDQTVSVSAVWDKLHEIQEQLPTGISARVNLVKTDIASETDLALHFETTVTKNQSFIGEDAGSNLIMIGAEDKQSRFEESGSSDVDDSEFLGKFAAQFVNTNAITASIFVFKANPTGTVDQQPSTAEKTAAIITEL